jgi:anaerobic ribonucleoside-triphosphate reductase activating protein
MRDDLLRVHSFLPYSKANGPGLRAVIWVQGCTLGCPGCFNPETHRKDGGHVVSVDEVYQRIAGLGDAIEGITVSGGEPLQQTPALIRLLRRVRDETPLSVLVFTGYTRNEVRAMPDADQLLGCIDVLIAGRYDQKRRLAPGLRGSADQTIHCKTNRYAHDQILSTPTTEVIVRPDGLVVLSGIIPAWQEGKG